MRRNLHHLAWAIEHLKALVPADAPDPQEYLLDLVERRRTDALGKEGQAQGIVPLQDDVQRRLGAAQLVAESLNDPARVLGMPEGIAALGVLEWLLRPAFLLHDGEFEPPAQGPWRTLSRSVARTLARSVCRIDLGMDGMDAFQVGTGFVAGRDDAGKRLVMTNAHVAREALAQGWRSLRGLELLCDFGRAVVERENAWIAAETCELHPSHDLAILRLGGERLASGEEVPPALSVSQTCPDPTEGRTVGVLGHPSFDSRRDSLPRLFGFGSELGVQRFSPGSIRAIERRTWTTDAVDVVLHDASTLSGSSGSCIFDLESGVVLALHFGGWPLPTQQLDVGGQSIMARLFEANGGVPLWQLRHDPILAGVAFRD